MKKEQYSFGKKIKNLYGSLRGCTLGVIAGIAIAANVAQADTNDNFNGTSINAGYGTEGARTRTVSSGDKYFVESQGFIGEESGGEIGLGRNDSQYADVQLSAEKTGDYMDIVFGARKRFDAKYLKSLKGNLYLKDVQGVDLEAAVPILNREKFNLDAVLGAYSLKSDFKDAAGLNIGLEADWRISKHLGFEGRAEYLSDKKLTGENFLASIGLVYFFGGRGRSGTVIEHRSLSSMSGKGGLLSPDYTSVPAITPNRHDNGNDSEPITEPGPEIPPETPANPPAEPGPEIPPETPETPANPPAEPGPEIPFPA